MAKYNYYDAIEEDIKNYIEESDLNLRNSNRDELFEKIYDDMWISDSVTGNASGSYTFNRWVAEENLLHNWDLVGEALDEFGCEGKTICKKLKYQDFEWFDVLVRCYLLGEVLSKVLDELLENLEESEEEEEEEEDEDEEEEEEDESNNDDENA